MASVRSLFTQLIKNPQNYQQFLWKNLLSLRRKKFWVFHVNQMLCVFSTVLSVQISDVYWMLIMLKRKAVLHTYGEKFHLFFALCRFVTAPELKHNSKKNGARQVRTCHVCVIKWPSVTHDVKSWFKHRTKAFSRRKPQTRMVILYHNFFLPG